MNMQGSFWTSGLAEAVGSTSSSIDALLKNPDLTLQQLLDDQDVLQECNALNSSLIDFLSRPASIEELVRNVITESVEVAPVADAEQTTTDVDDVILESEMTEDSGVADSTERNHDPYRNANMSSELFSCDVVAMLNALFSQQDSMALLFSFLEKDTPLNPRMAGYFRKVVAVLIQRCQDKVVTYIQEHPAVLQNLIKHIDDTSILELVLMLCWDDSGIGSLSDNKWLFELKLIPQLVSQLAPSSSSDTLQNASQALVDIVGKTTGSNHSFLVEHLQSPSVLNQLLDYALDPKGTSFFACISVVSMLLQREVLANSEFEAKELNWEVPFVVSAVVDRIDSIHHHLTSELHVPEPLQSTHRTTRVPLGAARLQAVQCIGSLLRGDFREANEAVAKTNLLPLIIDLFFEFEWHNILHEEVECIVQYVLCSSGPELMHSLFVDANLIERCMEAFQRNDSRIEESRGFRLGNLGHILRILNHVSQSQIQPVPKPDENAWELFRSGRLAQENEAAAVLLAGHRPSTPDDSDDDEPGISFESMNVLSTDSSRPFAPFSTNFDNANLENEDSMFDELGDDEQFALSFSIDDWPSPESNNVIVDEELVASFAVAASLNDSNGLMESNIVEYANAETPVQLRSEMVVNDEVAASAEASETPLPEGSSQPQQEPQTG